MRKLYIILGLLLLVPLISASWYDTGFIYRKEISFSNPYGNVTSFPLLVSLNTSQLIRDKQLQSDCDDILFTARNDSSTLLYTFENTTNPKYGCNGADTTYLWVRTDILMTNVTNDKNYLYYNKSTATSNISENVFSKFSFWYTFDQNITNISIDRSGHMPSIVPVEYTNRTASTMFVGYGYNLMGYPNPTSVRGGLTIPYSQWINTTTNWTWGTQVYYKGIMNEPAGGNREYYLLNRWTGSFVSQLNSNQRKLQITVANSTGGCANTIVLNSNTVFENLTRYFVTYSYNGTILKLFINGQLDNSVYLANVCDIVRNTNINSYAINNDTSIQSGNIEIDNFFWINQSLSDAEIKLMYYNLIGGLSSSSSSFSEIVSYVSPVVETSSTNISLNYSYDPSIYLDVFATLVYNNTEYTPTEISTSGNSYFLNTVTAPSVSTNTNIPLYYSVRLTNSSGQFYVNTSFYNQTVTPITSLNVTSALCPDRALYFDLQDEQNFTRLFGDFQYNFRYGIGSGSQDVAFGNFSNINNFSVCINSTASYNWIIGSGEIQYVSNGHVNRRYYTFDDMVVSNHTQNITLYDLLTSEQQSFQLVVEDTALNPQQGLYTTLLRWYPQINSYKIVDMGKTDILGSTVMHVEPEDVDYRVAVYRTDGTLIQMDSPTRMVCLVNPCTYTMRINPNPIDYSSLFGIQYSFTFNGTTKIFLFSYNDPSQTTNRMNLTVYQDTGTRNVQVCQSQTTGFTGVMQCNISAYSSGRFRAVVSRDGITFTQKVIDLISSPFTSQTGLWISLVIAIPIVMFMAFISPIAGVIGVIIALIPALYFGVFGTLSILIFGGIIVMGFIINHFLRRNS